MVIHIVAPNKLIVVEFCSGNINMCLTPFAVFEQATEPKH